MNITVFFTILIATYNVKSTFSQCIKSLNSQTFLDYEVIVSDGGSNDGTLLLINDEHIKNLAWFKSMKDDGIYNALNEGLKHANGRWLIVLGADDKLASPNSLAETYNIINYFDINNKVGLLYSNIYLNNASSIRPKIYPKPDIFSKMYSGGPFFHHQSVLINRAIVDADLHFNEEYKIHSDYDLMLRVAHKYGFNKIECFTTIYSTNGFSSKLPRLVSSIFEIITIRKKLNIKPLPLRVLLIYIKRLL